MKGDHNYDTPEVKSEKTPMLSEVTRRLRDHSYLADKMACLAETIESKLIGSVPKPALTNASASVDKVKSHLHDELSTIHETFKNAYERLSTALDRIHAEI
jgi:hypothetical protein